MELLHKLREQARGSLTEQTFDYYDGGAGGEQTIADNEAAWRALWIRPRLMVDVSAVDTSCTLLGRQLAMPILLAPMAAQRLLHEDGECGAARAAGAAGTVYCLSSRATTDLAEVAAAAPGPLWFQLYVAGDREHSAQVLARAAAHGFGAVLLTIDMPVGGRRERELRHAAHAFPDGVSLTSHLGYDVPAETKPVGGWDATLTWADVAWVRAASGLPVLVKGVLTAEDAVLALDAGADGIVVSNHGGRQLDGCVPTAVALPEVVEAVRGHVPVLVDGGIRDGGDVLRALALGAAAVLVGRPYAWGLATGGEAGVHAVVTAFAEDLRRVMALTGCPSLADVGRDRVRPAVRF
ncbi:MAG: 4-hydroxymandelate oxidase [Solirubrobacteraceae bacterium]|jgi:4-hydroxymandelate oxidase|nr:4-hydroxymandelate oxidase [Solirubrobacteraceae bacterium]